MARAKTQTANGTNERGPATQRHFVRAVEQETDAKVVISFSSREVSVNVPEGSINDVLDLVDEWGGEPSFDLSHDGWQYVDGVAVSVEF